MRKHVRYRGITLLEQVTLLQVVVELIGGDQIQMSLTSFDNHITKMTKT